MGQLGIMGSDYHVVVAMAFPRDIYATAKLLLNQRGLKSAADQCLDRMEELTAAGDKQGAHFLLVRLRLLWPGCMCPKKRRPPLN